MSSLAVVKLAVVHLLWIAALLTNSTAATAQDRLYEVQLDVYRSGELISSPFAVLPEGEAATAYQGLSTGSKLQFGMLVSSEGVVDGQALVSLALDLRQVDPSDVPDAAARSDRRIMAPTVFVKDSSKLDDPFTISQGDYEIAATVRRVETSRLDEYLSRASDADCIAGASRKEHSAAGAAVMSDGGCCETQCEDGQGPLSCCPPAVECCCGGNCCKPQPKVGF